MEGWLKLSEQWYVYLLLCADGTYYCGCTKDLERRFRQHNAGRGARYTRARLPVRMLVNKAVLGHGNALRLEADIKRLPRHLKQAALA